MESAAIGTRPLRCPTISIGAELCANWRLPGLFFETASLSSLYVGEGRRRCRLLAQSVSYCGAAPCPELGGKPDSITVEPVLFARRRLRGWRAWCKALMRRRIWLLKPTPSPSTANATPAMPDDTILPFSFPAVHAKKITAAFDGGRLTSNGGVMLLAMAERRLGLAEKLARVFPDRRDPKRVVHSLVDIFRARMFAICCGYEDADDLDHLRSDPAFKLACGRLPDTGRDLCSQPTLSRLENAPRLRDVIRLTYTLVDAWMDSYPHEPESVTLDIDDTCDVVHGHQQLSLFNAHYDERCFLPIHVYDTEKSRPVAVVLRPGKTPSGVEVRAHLRRLVRHIRTRWHKTRITFRDDGHYARPEAMTWCENNGIDYIFGLSGTKPLARKVDEVADDIRTRRAIENLPVLRGYTETRHQAKSWDRERRAVARIEATKLGLDIRFVVTSLDVGSAEWIYDSLYCARGQAENLIKLHKTQLASDRTSCRSALANQVRLVLHTAAYWLMLTVRDAIPKVQELATAEFATLRLRLLKIAARVVETASRIRLAFAAACPEADLIRSLPGALLPLGPCPAGPPAPFTQPIPQARCKVLVVR